MLSYRHAYHAGNFADVLKHVVLVEILQHLVKKDSAFDYIDTHAGAGLYFLNQAPVGPGRGVTAQGARPGEHRDGIARLAAAEWPELARYFDILQRVNADGSLYRYPGSPLIALHFLRRQDRAWLFELHSRDVALLERHIAQNPLFRTYRTGGLRARVLHEDGFKGLLALLPPISRRGLILIDPSYEIKTDYARVFDTLAAAWKKFSTGIYALWYPVVERGRIDSLEKKFRTSGIGNIQRFELAVAADAPGYGMTAAGMIVVNPPWTLMAKMSLLLPRLVDALGQQPGAFYQCDILAGEQERK